MLKAALIILLLLSTASAVLAESEKSNKNLYKGIITNKKFAPLKLKISQIDKKSILLINRNLEDNSFVPIKDLNLTASITENYLYEINDATIKLPKETILTGYISKIEPSKTFNREGVFEVTFNQAICPDGHKIKLKNILKSQSELKIYHPLHHLGKTTASILGGSIAGSILSLQIGGIGSALSTQGYSIAAGAAAGGFIGILSGVLSKGKEASVQPGSELVLAPIDETSLEKLNQIACNDHLTAPSNNHNTEDINLEVISIKETKDILGDTSVMIDIRFTNNSEKSYKLNNFFLIDSQGKEYSPSIINSSQDLFAMFPAFKTTKTRLDFFVNYPNADHWLILKDTKFTKEAGKWKMEVN